MSDFQFQDENSIRAVFSMEVGREMNDHNMLYNKSLPNQHPISAITGLTEALAEGSSNLQTEIDRAEAAEQALDDKIEAETTRAEGVESGLNTAISNETSARIQADTTLQNNITAEENRAKGIENGLRSDLTAETTARQNADNNLQSQIDAISASSDVTDIVGTYAELQAYDTSTLTNDDIIKVLQDESQGGATTYYRWVVSGSSGSFVLIGSEGPYYTKAEADELYDEKQDKITATNKLSSDLVNDTNQTNKFVTASEKSQITTNANNIVDLQNSKASTSLDNLTATGQMIIDSQNGTISNCVLEIPQNLKLTLENNALTLKAGSVVTLARDTYVTYTVANDLVRANLSLSEGKRYMFFTNNDGTSFTWNDINVVGSGASLPADNSSYSVFFLTTDKNVYTWSSGAWVKSYRSYPICILESNNGTASFAKDSNGNDMIFNGAGFIGHHAFIYPNVRYLSGNGFDTNGKLASYRQMLGSLTISEMNSTTTTGDWFKAIVIRGNNNTVAGTAFCRNVQHFGELLQQSARLQYVADDNICYAYSSGGWQPQSRLFYIRYEYDGIDVTDFTIRQPVRLATTEMIDEIQDQVDTKQDTLISGTNIKTINNNSILSNGNIALADQSLSNLDSTGQMVIDSQNGTISNCVLEIPQNIKLTLENNVLTLKAGSILTRTGDTYATVTTTADITFTAPTSATYGKRCYILATATPNQAGLGIRNIIENVSSGSSLPESVVNGNLFFNTSDKLIYEGVSGVWTVRNFVYPLGLIDVDSVGNISFAKDSNGNDMIFNGAGFIGHHAFVYPNVKALIPDGFNDDGSMKSISVTRSALTIREIVGNQYFSIGSATAINPRPSYFEVNTLDDLYAKNLQGFYYVKSLNQCYSWGGGSGVLYAGNCVFIHVNISGEIVTDFAIRQPVRTATVEMLKDKQNDLTTVSGYDATTTQILKHVNGVLTWVTEE